MLSITAVSAAPSGSSSLSSRPGSSDVGIVILAFTVFVVFNSYASSAAVGGWFENVKPSTHVGSAWSPKTSFDPIVSAHSGDPLLVYKSIVRNAINFFNEELVKFSAENIIMGITVLNKTKDVADYLQSVMRYGQSGSLYEVVHEVDTLIAAGIPGDLAPFVTDARLTALKNQILDYLA